RPLRNVSWTDDLWGPFVRWSIATLMCFAPVFFLPRFRFSGGGLVTAALFISATLFGIFFFPAVLLTTTTSGSYENLRPDRLTGVIKALGASYWLNVLSFIIAAGIYL